MRPDARNYEYPVHYRRGSDNPAAKLTEDQVAEIKALLAREVRERRAVCRHTDVPRQVRQCRRCGAEFEACPVCAGALEECEKCSK